MISKAEGHVTADIYGALLICVECVCMCVCVFPWTFSVYRAGETSGGTIYETMQSNILLWLLCEAELCVVLALTVFV